LLLVLLPTRYALAQRVAVTSGLSPSYGRTHSNDSVDRQNACNHNVRIHVTFT